MGVQMIVKKEFRPGGSGSPLLKAGSSFVADSEQQARLCRAMGWCEEAPTKAQAEPAASGGTYATRMMTATLPTAKTAPAKKVAAKKTAKRTSDA